MNLTFAITVYNRWELLLESFAGIIDDPRIDEILICDDHSADEYWNKIKDLGKFNPKIKVIRQLENRGMLENKRDAIYYSKNEWVIIADSDNVFTKEYIDNIPQIRRPQTIYSPSFGRPNFDYRLYQGQHITKEVVQQHINEDMFNCFLNTFNCVVHRETFLSVWQKNDVKSADSIWFNYLWLKAGNGFYICPRMWYDHRVHSGSGFLADYDESMEKAKSIKKIILAL